MSSLTAPDSMADLLRQTRELTEIRDSNGNVIGIFAPTPIAAATPKGEVYTTKEVFEHLLSLTEDEELRAHLQKIIEEVRERDACVSQ